MSLKNRGVKVFCHLELSPEKKSPLGWSAKVVAIWPTTWREIRASLESMGRNDLDDPSLVPNA